MERCYIDHIEDGGSRRRGAVESQSWIDARRLVTLFGVVVTSTAEETGKIYAVIPPEDGMAEDGGKGF